MSPLDWETSPVSVYKVSYYSQLLISIQKYKDSPCTWAADDHTGHRNRRLEAADDARIVVDDGSAMRVWCICMLPSPNEGRIQALPLC